MTQPTARSELCVHTGVVPGRRIESIQVLRAYAAWLVVFHHFHQIINGFDRSTAWGRVWSECGDYAVYVFFIISGLIIHHTLQQSSSSAWTFLRRRLLRIALPYWVATALFTLVLFVTVGSAWSNTWSIKALVMSLIFVAYPHPSGAGLYPILTVGWSLNYEVLFYVLVACALAVCRDRWSLLLGAILLMLPWAWPANWPYGAILSAPLWLLFPVGMAMSQWMASPPPPDFRAVAALVALLVLTGALLASPLGANVLVKMGLAAALVALTMWCQRWISVRSLIGRLAVRLGDWSYATYLIHPVILFVVERSHWMPKAMQYKILACVAYGALVLIGSWAFHRWVEGAVLSPRHRKPVTRRSMPSF